jgi:NAD(P)-dependent dehydrogenase (short-subunit alcohol dehydrogenase family)
MRIDYSDKVVLITGAAAGIGALAARNFANAGAQLALADIQDEKLQRLQKDLAASTRCYTEICNISDADNIKQFINNSAAYFGRIDVAINNAGILHKHNKLADLPVTDIDQQLTINARGVYLSMKYQLQQMLRQQHGVILNMSSAAGIFGAPGASAYSAAKHAVTGMTRSAALEYARYGIRINCLCPSFIDSPMVDEFEQGSTIKKQQLAAANPMKRLGTMQEVVNAMLWLCSDYNSYMTGQAIALDGGLTAI